MNANFFWLIACVLFVILELATPTAFISIWFAVGSFIAMTCAFLNIDIWIQIILFFFTSLISMLLIRPISTSYLKKNIVKTNADRIVGEIATVKKPIYSDEWGIVKVNGMEWSAVEINHQFVDEKQKVKVIAIEGAKLIVQKL